MYAMSQTSQPAAADPVPVSTRTLKVTGAELSFNLHGDPADASAERPTLMIVGTPMGAEGFGTLARKFSDRPVITYDPRNVGHSRRDDDTVTPTPEDHAADLQAIMDEVGGPFDLFGNSGGAINALALASADPRNLRIVVAHEPPTVGVLPDADQLVAACRDIQDAYQRSGSGIGMAKFIALVSQEGELGPDYAERPDPDPAMFGLPTTDDGSRNDPLMENMSTIPVWIPDLDALRAADCRVVLAVGVDSGTTMAARAPRAIAEQSGLELVEFPGDHGGYLGGEYGQTGKPDEFAAALREVLGG